MSRVSADGVPGSLIPFLGAVTWDEHDATHRGCDFFAGAAFDDAVTRFARPFPCADPRAVISAWSMYYLSSLVIPATAALVCHDQILPVGLDDATLDVDERGHVCRLCLMRGQPKAMPGSRFEALVAGHLEPMIAACHHRTHLSRRILWNNAAVVLDYALTEIIRSGVPTCARALDEAKALLEGTPWPMLERPYATRPDDQRVRRLCCLRYRLPGHDLCPGICPMAARRECKIR